MLSEQLKTINFFITVYFTALLDIFIAALFIYSVMIFIRRTRSHMVFLGLAIIVGLYFLAKFLSLELTLLSLQYFVGASVVVFAVVFQTEIRKYFELLGLIGTRQINVRPLHTDSPTLVEIIHACISMAQDKIGALIVIQGREVVDSYIEGGIDLDAVISEELILSIFDPNSEGHDGAIIVANNRIAKFSAHLPLSTNFKLLGKHGTRHSAGLGLSENTDALCVVVSEEKGTISICRNANMKTLSNFSDLEKEIDKFVQAKFYQRTEGLLMFAVKHNFWLKVVALVSATVMWALNSWPK